MEPVYSAVFVAYISALVAGVVFSFNTRKGPLRLIIRILTGVLTAPILLILAIAFILWDAQPPSLARLQHDFPSKRSDLEMILRMSDEDSTFSRIAPGFLDRVTDGTSGYGRYMRGDPKAGLPEPRWSAYRAIYKRNGIKLGIQRDASRDAFIMVDSFGILSNGHTSGYLYCVPNPPANSYRFDPCVLHQDKSEREYSSNPQREGYSFQKLDDRWYAYDEGPS